MVSATMVGSDEKLEGDALEKLLAPHFSRCGPDAGGCILVDRSVSTIFII